MLHTERSRRYALLETGTLIVEDTVLPSVVGHYVDVDLRLGTIELPEGKFDLVNFLRVAEAIRENLRRYRLERGKIQWLY